MLTNIYTARYRFGLVDNLKVTRIGHVPNPGVAGNF